MTRREMMLASLAALVPVPASPHATPLSVGRLKVVSYSRTPVSSGGAVVGYRVAMDCVPVPVEEGRGLLTPVTPGCRIASSKYVISSDGRRLGVERYEECCPPVINKPRRVT